jgi:hypothetical protein
MPIYLQICRVPYSNVKYGMHRTVRIKVPVLYEKKQVRYPLRGRKIRSLATSFMCSLANVQV